MVLNCWVAIHFWVMAPFRMGRGRLVNKVNNILCESDVGHVYFDKITERHTSETCSHLGISHGNNRKYDLVYLKCDFPFIEDNKGHKP